MQCVRSVSGRLLSAALICLMATFAVADDKAIQRAVVKIRSKNRSISLTSPWRRQTPSSVSGSGVLIGPGRVLTNSHVVLNSSEITLQPFDSSERIPAKLKVLAPGIDLAIVEFEPEGGLTDVVPLPLAEKSPAVRSTVRVYGYPTGGSAQSVTEGIISRIEHTLYRFSTRGLRIQIDAAINPGNSGGPAIVDGKIAGLAFSTRPDANDIGYVIPPEEIHLFLNDIADGNYDGKPRLNINYQYLENRALRRKLKLESDVTGVLCQGVRDLPDSPLRSGDVITQIAGRNVDNRGHCKMDNDVTLTVSRAAVEYARDGIVDVNVIRDGSEVSISVPVDGRLPLVGYLMGRTPRYFIFGPVVFSEATADYLNVLDVGMQSSNSRQRRATASIYSMMRQGHSPFLQKRYTRRANAEDELVVVTKLLTHETARGYRPMPYPFTVQSINDQPVNNLQQLVEILRDADGEFVDIRFFDTIGDQITLDRQAALDATEALLEDNGILRQGSRELLEVWSENE